MSIDNTNELVEVVRLKFSGSRVYPQGQDINRIRTDGGGTVTSASAMSRNATNYVITLTDWTNMDASELYENLLIYEPEVGATIVKVAEMVRASFDYFMLIDDAKFDNIQDYYDDEGNLIKNVGEKSLQDEMVDTANDMAKTLDIKTKCFETWTTLLYSQGEIFLQKHPNLSLSIIPNNRVTILDSLDHIQGYVGNGHYLMTEENYLIIDEGLDTQVILDKDEFIHLKLSDVPVNIKDIWGRNTFGIYGISPLQRCIIPCWLKRQIYVTEIQWRNANVPREHHTIDANAFNPAQFQNLSSDKRFAYAASQLNSAIQTHAKMIKEKTPDQHYVTSSNVKIQSLAHSGSSYIDSNSFLKQIQDNIWDALGIPPSIVRGKSDGSYAGELIISSGLSLRIEQIASKIGAIVLDNIKERLLKIDEKYPVQYLDIKVSFELAESKLEKYKMLGLQKASGLFTPTECRETVDYPALTKDQINEEGLVTPDGIVVGENNLFKTTPSPTKPTTTQSNITEDFGGISGVRSNGTVNYPTTPHSASKQPTDSGDAVTKDVTDTENYM